jgi:HD-GYP domain-containing protein (c-di-GMP phosphodiesterase class II)
MGAKKSTRDNAARVLLHVSRIMSSSPELDTVNDAILRESRKALGADHVSLFLLDQETGYLDLIKAEGFTADQIDNLKLLGSWEVINEQLVEKKKIVVANDVRKSQLFKDKTLPFSSERLPIHSFLAAPLVKDGATVGALIVSNKKRSNHHFTKHDADFLSTLSNYIAIALISAKLYIKLKELFITTVKSLVKAVDAKDQYTSGHSERVMKYAYTIGKEMGLGHDTMENLKLSSLLHDIGKLGIKESVLSKPGKLSARERRQVSHHPAIGVKIVDSIADSHKIIRGILEHHEHFDGKGYPNGLKAGEISLEGRIIAVADTFDAMTTARPYNRKYSPEEARLMVKKGSGTQFDPHVVRVFMRSYSKHPEVWQALAWAGHGLAEGVDIW